ncbi:MAG: NAD(P)/FAD-dependent oxidoreductase [Deltaproteobacteria bacterium]|nr:NAD(P)/FAD-dependent oxidoreductase [Deltaproteobacteria bacterium]
MSEVIIIGAGVNGLACAVELARAGKKVTVVEQRAEVGGLSAARRFSGFSVPGIRHDTNEIRPALIDALQLAAHGLKLAGHTPIYAAGPDGGLVLHHESDDAAAEIAKRSAKDAEAYAAFRRFTLRLRPVVDALLAKAAPPLLPNDLGDAYDMGRLGLKLRGLGRDDMLELLRVAPMCVADWLREMFETEILSATLAFPAVAGDFVGPWSAGTSATLILQQALAVPGVVGGPAAVVDALSKALASLGGTVRTSAKVAKVSLTNEAVSGVVLASGETLKADAVVACCAPRTALLDLLPRGALGLADRQAAQNIRARGSVAKVHLGLKAAPKWSGRSERFARVRIGAHLDDLERAFDAVKYREVAEKPALDVALFDDGAKVAVSVIAFGVPYEAEDRKLVEARVLEQLEAHAPGVKASVEASEVLLPRDLEAEYGSRSVHHVERALDQMLFMRPARPFARATTPVRGLLLGSSGCHPGPGVTLAPGVIAARALLSS